MTIPLRGSSTHHHPNGQAEGAARASVPEAVAQAIAERLVASGREGGPRRPPPATPEERQARVDAVREKILERGHGGLHALHAMVRPRAVPRKSPEKA